MAHTLEYKDRKVAESRHKDMKEKGYKPTRIQQRGGKYKFSIK